MYDAGARPEGYLREYAEEFASVEVQAHQMIVLPRSIGPMRLPFGNLARAANKYCSEHFIETFKHSNCFVNHHDVVATK